MYTVRWFIFFLGVTLLGAGNAMAVNVKYLGLNPWDVLNVALFDHLGLSIGSWGVLTGFFLILVTLIMDKKYISLGTFLNALAVGPIMDFFLWSGILPESTNVWADCLILLMAVVIAGIGGGMYVAAGLGAGPRDGFMLSISDKTGLSVSRARILMESAVLIAGFLLGGPVFIASFIYTFIQSPVFQWTFKQVKGIIFKRQQTEPVSR